ncbi:Rrf2 family transcriptional regulator [Endozoicomonas numazuensis]|uniref:BadM/Rrf2 family transcriptional regulator n=1 Tax=Endozoicomonas numazuensis TaxID=1137799 RepID=A0A081NEJ0_9GAMM|nr:Rrf2 family transcriptional regulator [Endozoicomonas numazuensis]KEQ16863.1 BadM/Rrf2 family transcriptional regulator [Endozoicomonas numazuensis]
MKLTRHTDYALRILIYSALQPQSRLISIQEVTDVYDLSRNHVMKIVQRLGQEGYLSTIRGKGGGFRIGLSAEDINLGVVVRMMESTTVLIDCDEPVCRISPSCRLKGILADAMSAFMAVLDSYTLADLIENRKELAGLLAVG